MRYFAARFLNGWYSQPLAPQPPGQRRRWQMVRSIVAVRASICGGLPGW
jgi:hypothetical protein